MSLNEEIMRRANNDKTWAQKVDSVLDIVKQSIPKFESEFSSIGDVLQRHETSIDKLIAEDKDISQRLAGTDVNIENIKDNCKEVQRLKGLNLPVAIVADKKDKKGMTYADLAKWLVDSPRGRVVLAVGFVIMHFLNEAGYNPVMIIKAIKG